MLHPDIKVYGEGHKQDMVSLCFGICWSVVTFKVGKWGEWGGKYPFSSCHFLPRSYSIEFEIVHFFFFFFKVYSFKRENVPVLAEIFTASVLGVTSQLLLAYITPSLCLCYIHVPGVKSPGTKVECIKGVQLRDSSESWWRRESDGPHQVTGTIWEVEEVRQTTAERSITRSGTRGVKLGFRTAAGQCWARGIVSLFLSEATVLSVMGRAVSA